LAERGIAEEEAKLRLVPGFGKPAEHLAQLATEEKAGLVLFGTHHRRGLARLWHGSVSRDALVGCPTNAMVVPG
jgi:nucleotide-binding universal stress UspA family protein